MIKRLGEFWRQRRCVMEVDLWCLDDIGNSGLPSWKFIIGCWAPQEQDRRDICLCIRQKSSDLYSFFCAFTIKK